MRCCIGSWWKPSGSGASAQPHHSRMCCSTRCALWLLMCCEATATLGSKCMTWCHQRGGIITVSPSHCTTCMRWMCMHSIWSVHASCHIEISACRCTCTATTAACTTSQLWSTTAFDIHSSTYAAAYDSTYRLPAVDQPKCALEYYPFHSVAYCHHHCYQCCYCCYC
jgi:hypothetical protein